jgi:predicted SprT family Zn-dependent metalloprotease
MADEQKVRGIVNREEAKALLWLLVKEKKRHEKDIKQIVMDILIITTKYQIPIPDPEDVWIDPSL